MIHMIYLAAGNSRRFQGNKLLYEYRGKPLYTYGLSLLERISRKREDVSLTVVTQYREIEAAVLKSGISCVFCEEAVNGVSYSIRSGIRSLKDLQEDDYLLFLVADQPYLSEETLEALLQLAKSPVKTACVRYKDQNGNPCLFSAELVPDLLALKGDRGGKALFAVYPPQTVEVKEKRELFDIDERKNLS